MHIKPSRLTKSDGRNAATALQLRAQDRVERDAVHERALLGQHYSNKITSSDSEDDKKHKGFKIGSSGTPVK
ncbi:hypothetical protein PF004_g12067 [Phytophthora fragariae]|uniref:Uncharacterized protein n=1 Tax=Phytophthora fragariae TaxID=53985 RepID=A0A6G0NW79_9STRA|nr:hypothetical protein PF004_g12067 [Phytophthora fragariae]